MFFLNQSTKDYTMKKLTTLAYCAMACFGLQAQTLSENFIANGQDRDAGDIFGNAVSMDGEFAIIGSQYDDEDANGNSPLITSGSAEIFKYVPLTDKWTSVQKLSVNDRNVSDYFGCDVAISGDNVIVGAYGQDFDTAGNNSESRAGAAYIFEQDAYGTWSQKQKLVASDRDYYDYFGWKVCIDSQYAAVAAYYEDEDETGSNTLSNAGAVYIFETDTNGDWQEVQKIVASDRNASDYFGSSLAISGDYLIVGAASQDYDENGASFKSSAGAAYIFERSVSGTWTEVQKIVAPDRYDDDEFGSSVDVDGDVIVVGAPNDGDTTASPAGATVTNAGSVYAFKRDGSGVWNFEEKITSSDRATGDVFGTAVSLSGNYLVVGAPEEDEDASGLSAMTDPGSAYFFERDALANWTELHKIDASSRHDHDELGSSVALSYPHLVLGTTGYDYFKAGLDYQSLAGAAFFYSACDFTVNTYASPAGDCANGVVDVAVFGAEEPLAYDWSTDGIGDWDDDVHLTGLAAGSYTVVIEDSLGCMEAESVEVMTSNTHEEVLKAVSTGRDYLDYFGISVDLSGRYAIIGARNEDEDENDANTLNDAGAAYIYERDTFGNWNLEQKIVASDRGAYDYFGHAVSISGDHVIVGAYNEDHNVSGNAMLNDAGAAYFFERDGSGVWNEVRKVVASDRGAEDNFGFDVSISGTYAVVGAHFQDSHSGDGITDGGAAYVFERHVISGNWVQRAKLVANTRNDDDHFGYSVAIDRNGYLLAGAYNVSNGTGAAYAFARHPSGLTWVQDDVLTASDGSEGRWFGWSVALDSNMAAVGAYKENTDQNGQHELTAAGAVYVFKRVGVGFWVEEQKLVAYDRESGASFGYSVAMSEGQLLVGAMGEDEDTLQQNNLNGAGALYLFEEDANGDYLVRQKITTSDRENNDYFGYCVALDSGYVLGGAWAEDEDASGANELNNSGSAYFFEPCEPGSGSSKRGVKASEEIVAQFAVYPNPASDQVQLGLSGFNESVQVRLYSMQGTLLTEQQFSNDTNVVLGVQKLSTGMYVVTANDGVRLEKTVLVVE